MSEDSSIFISYSRDDLAFADQIDAALQLCGFTTTLDRHGIVGGEDWRSRLSLLIRDADTIVFIGSPSSATSETCAWEIAEAVSLGKRIIPVMCRQLEGVEVPAQIRHLDFIFFYDDPRLPGGGFGTGLARLVNALKTDLGWLREHTRLIQRASEWEAGGRSEIRLLSGDDISDAKAWVAKRPNNAPEPTTLQHEFILASEQVEASRNDEAQRRILAMQAAQDDRAKALASAEHAARRLAGRSKAFIAVSTALAALALGFAFHSLRSAKQAFEAQQIAETKGAEALAAAKRAEAAYEVAVDSADRFLTDLTGKFKDTAAVPEGELRQLLSRGETFLSEMAGRMGAAPRLAWVESRLLARFAELSLDIDIHDAKARLDRSEESMATAVASDPQAYAYLKASLHLQKSRIAFEMREYKEQLEQAQHGLKIISSADVDTIAHRLAKADAFYSVARAQWKVKEYEASVKVSTDCIDLLKSDQGDDVEWMRVQCLHIRAVVFGAEALNREAEAAADLTEELRILDGLIQRNPSNITYRRTRANAFNNKASSYYSLKQWQAFVDQVQLAVGEGEQALRIAPWSVSMKSALGHYLRWQGKAYENLGRYTDAVRVGSRSLDLRRELMRADSSNTGRISDYEDSLDEAAANYVSIDKKDLSSAQQAERYRMLLERRDYYIGKYGLKPRNPDEFFSVYEARVRAAEAQAWLGEPKEALQTIMELAAIMDAAVDRHDPNPRYRYWSHWARSSFGACRAFLDSPNVDIEDKLEGCQRTAQWVEAYIKREPKDWLIKAGYGNVLMNIAALHMQRGRQRLAIGAMEEAAFRGSRDATEKLEQWYRTGDGPTGVDPAKAKSYAQALSSRNWGMKRFTVPVFWWGSKTRSPAHFYIVDPSEAAHDPVEDEIFRFEQIQGLLIPDDVKDSFRKLLKIAVDNKVSFQDLTVYALGTAASEANDRLLNVLLQTADDPNKPSSKTEKKARALARARQDWRTKDGSTTLAAAFEEMSKRGAAERLMLAEYADDFEKGGPPELAILALTALINGPTAGLLDRTTLLARRGKIYSAIGNARRAEDDLLVAIAVWPNDPVLLNTLGYTWLEHNQSLDVAVGFLERAAKAAPDDPQIADSLGWAYIKTGKLQTGVEILRSVVSKLPDMPEGYAHLADGLRRLGRRAEARNVLEQATAKQTGTGRSADRLGTFIADQRRLLSD